MKRKYIITVAVLLIIAGILYLNRIEPLLTGKPADVKQISISSLENQHVTKREYTNESDIEGIMETIQKIEKRYTKRHPSYAESLQTDSSFTMEILYKDGIKDKVNLSSEGERKSLNRFLDTEGGQGDPGYTGVHNVYLYDYLTKLFADKERGKEVTAEEGWPWN